MRSRLRLRRASGVGGTEPAGDLWLSLFAEDKLDEVEVLEIMEFLVLVDSSDNDLCRAPVDGGLASTGVKALRKSV